MALTGLQIYKLLPRTNCKECGFPTCLAFAMKLAAKQAELAACPYVSEEAKAQLAAAAAPPIRLVTVEGPGHKVEVGNETVLFRHEKTFYHKPGIFVRVKDTMPLDEIKAAVKAAMDYSVEYVGMDLFLDGIAVEAASGDADAFAAAVQAVREVTDRPLILIAEDGGESGRGHPSAALCCRSRQLGTNGGAGKGTPDNWEPMAALAKEAQVSLAVRSLDGLGNLAELAEQGQGCAGLGVGSRCARSRQHIGHADTTAPPSAQEEFPPARLPHHHLSWRGRG